jgi:hypothetical protein
LVVTVAELAAAFRLLLALESALARPAATDSDLAVLPPPPPLVGPALDDDVEGGAPAAGPTSTAAAVRCISTPHSRGSLLEGGSRMSSSRISAAAAALAVAGDFSERFLGDEAFTLFVADAALPPESGGGWLPAGAAPATSAPISRTSESYAASSTLPFAAADFTLRAGFKAGAFLLLRGDLWDERARGADGGDLALLGFLSEAAAGAGVLGGAASFLSVAAPRCFLLIVARRVSVYDSSSSSSSC